MKSIYADEFLLAIACSYAQRFQQSIFGNQEKIESTIVNKEKQTNEGLNFNKKIIMKKIH